MPLALRAAAFSFYFFPFPFLSSSLTLLSWIRKKYKYRGETKAAANTRGTAYTTTHQESRSVKNGSGILC